MHAKTARRPGRVAVDPDMGTDDWAIVKLAQSQHGVFSGAQLMSLGITRGELDWRVRVGRLHRLHRGVYSLTPPVLVRPHGRLEAAVLALGPESAISMRSAAALLGLLSYQPATPQVTVRRHGGKLSRPGIEVHVSSTLRIDRDVARVDGIPVTTVARTFLDLACIFDGEQMLRLLDSAAGAYLLNPIALREQIKHAGARGRQRASLPRMLDLYEIGRGIDWDRIQRYFGALVRKYGLPAPEAQVWIDLEDGEQPIRPDFLWRNARLIVETDGWGAHSGRRAFERDRRRDQRAAAAGFQTLRVTWRQIVVDGERLATTIRPLASGDLTRRR